MGAVSGEEASVELKRRQVSRQVSSPNDRSGPNGTAVRAARTLRCGPSPANTTVVPGVSGKLLTRLCHPLFVAQVTPLNPSANSGVNQIW